MLYKKILRGSWLCTTLRQVFGEKGEDFLGPYLSAVSPECLTSPVKSLRQRTIICPLKARKVASPKTAESELAVKAKFFWTYLRSVISLTRV